MAKEQIIEIADSILRHISYEKEDNYTNRAVGRVKLDYNKDLDQVIWIINKEDHGGYLKEIDITGGTRDTITGNPTTYKGDGKVVCKNHPLGGLLIMKKAAVTYKAPIGLIDLYIFNLSKYLPIINADNSVDGKDVVIEYEDGEILQYRSLQEIKATLNKFQKEIDEKTEELSKEIDKSRIKLLNDEISAKKTDRDEIRVTLQNFIRDFAQLRILSILDPEQEEIKRSNIFRKPLVINGGPGTGKTTVLIQRIKFLTSSTIQEYSKLTNEQKDLIFDEKKSWIFFSPSNLLSLYLKNAMVEEGLKASDERVKVWSEHRTVLIRAYKLINTDTRRPFLAYHKNQKTNIDSFYKTDKTSIKKLISSYDSFLLKYFTDKFRKTISLDLKQFHWQTEGKAIVKFISDKQGFKEIHELLSLFFNLQESFYEGTQPILDNYKQIHQQVAGRIALRILDNPERKLQIESLLKDWFKNEPDISDPDDEEEIEQEVFEEQPEAEKIFDFNVSLNRKLKTLVRKYALKLYDINVRFTKNDNILIEKIPEVKEQVEYSEIGQGAFFKKHFERLLKGIESNLFRELHLVYKQFRKIELKRFLTPAGKHILQEIIGNKNKHIHPDEQSFLIYEINRFNRQFAKNYRMKFFNSNHSYCSAFRNNMKPVIGIDEATDFSMLDLLCISSFAHTDISSVTFSGDIMQRMTPVGLKQWKDLKYLIPEIQIKDLTVSYRQSSTLLEIAQKIYHQSTGLHPQFKAHLKKNDKEPQPLIYLDNSEENKIGWIADRILEIFKVYGELVPSIAVFIKSDEQLDIFTSKLSEKAVLSDVDIKVKACREGLVLGDKNTIRVFTLKYIKGLEFEAVFFHNIDEVIERESDKDLLDKYLYVGLSRAAMYMGVTVSEKFKGKYGYLNELFSPGDWKI